MPGDRLEADITTVIEKKGRHYLFPALGRISGDNFAVLFHDAPAREPSVLHDPESFLAMATGTSFKKIERKSAKAIPRFPHSGYAPSLTRITEDKLAIIDDSWHIYNWMGEMHVRVVPFYDWVLIPRGAHLIIVDTSSGVPRFGKPRRITSLDYPVLSCYDSPVIEDDNTIICPGDYDIDCTQVETRPWETVLMRTSDFGKTWELHGAIYMEKDYDDLPKIHRPSVARAGGGRLACAMVESGDNPAIYTTFSSDGGRTWAKPGPAGFEGVEHSLSRLEDGRLLMVYMSKDNTGKIHLRLSGDKGRTWPETADFFVDISSAGNFYGRPRAMQLPSGSVFVAFHIQKNPKTGIIAGVEISL